MSIPNFVTWYKLPSYNFRIYDYETKQLSTSKTLDFKCNQFEYKPKHVEDKTDDKLIEYAEILIFERNQILSSKALKLKFDYFDNSFKYSDDKIFYRNHSNNIKNFLKRFMKKDHLEYDPIDIYEEKYYASTYRAGLTYAKPGIYDCWTYDFKFFYPIIMSSKEFMISKKKGEIKKISKIKSKFEYGVYNIQINSNDENFNKVFAFSEDNYYTHHSLNFVSWYNKKYKANIQMTLLSEDALIYDKNFLVEGGHLFYCWYMRLSELKAEFPKNKLIKSLGSTAWGELQSRKTIIKTEDEIINENLNIGVDFDKDYYIKKVVMKNDEELYYLIPTKEKIYEFNLRIKAFITDLARIKMAKIALNNIEDVIRIQTDSITYIRSIEHNIDNFILDNDKTGKFHIKN